MPSAARQEGRGRLLMVRAREQPTARYNAAVSAPRGSVKNAMPTVRFRVQALPQQLRRRRRLIRRTTQDRFRGRNGVLEAVERTKLSVAVDIGEEERTVLPRHPPHHPVGAALHDD